MRALYRLSLPSKLVVLLGEIKYNNTKSFDLFECWQCWMFHALTIFNPGSVELSLFPRMVLVLLVSQNLALSVANWFLPDPQLILRKIAYLTVKKLPKIFFFYKKIVNGNFWGKKTIFGNCSEKNVKFLAIFWHSNSNFPEGQLCTK